MTVSSDVFTRLSAFPGLVALLAARVYPLLLPQEVVLPAISYQRISGVREQSLTGDSALQHPRFQFSCWAETYAEALAVAEQVRLALQGITAAGGGYYEGAFDLYDSETGWYYVPVDITIWHN